MEMAKSGKTAALLNSVQTVLEMNVANILPNDEIIAELRYTELFAKPS